MPVVNPKCGWRITFSGLAFLTAPETLKRRQSLNWKGRFVPYMLLLVIFTGCAGSHSWQALPESSEDERTIYVVSHGWHTGLILPYESLSALPDLEKVLGESTYYEF